MEIDMKRYFLILMCLLLLSFIVSPASAWITGYGSRQVVNVIGDATWTTNATNYPTVIHIYNDNGVSYGNTIFLNGTGSSFQNIGGTAIINDLRFADASDNQYPYWIEHTASNNTHWKVWVKIPTIYKTTSTPVYIYYGNSAATSVMNMPNTFTVGDDFDEATINTTTWSYNATQVTPTLSLGVGYIFAPYCYGLYSNTKVPVGDEVRAYIGKSITTQAVMVGIGNASAIGYGEQAGYMSWMWRYDSSHTMPVAITSGGSENTVQYTTAGNLIYNIERVNSTISKLKINDGTYNLVGGGTYNFSGTDTAYPQSIWIGGDATSSSDRTQVNWIMSRHVQTPEPSFAVGNAGPTVDFVANRTRGNVPMSVNFTDLSYGYPATWSWDFGDNSIGSFDQNPSHTYTDVGTFNVTLVAANSNGTVTKLKTNYIITDVMNQTGYGAYYAAQTTTFHVQSAFGSPISGATVTMQGVSTSTGSFDWLGQLLGLKLVETPINTQLMTATTDSNGDAQFMVLPSVYYTVTVFKTGVINKTLSVTPTESKYTIPADWNIFGTTGVSSLSAIAVNVTTFQYNATYMGILVTGNDTLGHITGGVVNLNQTNTITNGTENLIGTYTIPASNFTKTFYVNNYKGKSYIVRLNITQSDYGNVIRDYGVTFKNDKVNPMGLDSKMLMLISMGILILFGAIFTSTTAHNGALLTCFIGWILYGIGWMEYGGTIIPLALTFATVISFAVIIAVGRLKS
jgi:PKD repeat protein